jgi:hypothetical protein
VPTKVRLLYVVPVAALTVVAVVFELWLTVFIGLGLIVWLLAGAGRARMNPPRTPGV